MEPCASSFFLHFPGPPAKGPAEEYGDGLLYLEVGYDESQIWSDFKKIKDAMDRHVPLTIFIPWTHYCMMERQQLFKMEQNKKYDKSPYHLLAKRTDKAGVGGEGTDTYPGLA